MAWGYFLFFSDITSREKKILCIDNPWEIKINF